jgi:hypothetical protein
VAAEDAQRLKARGDFLLWQACCIGSVEGSSLDRCSSYEALHITLAKNPVK